MFHVCLKNSNRKEKSSIRMTDQKRTRKMAKHIQLYLLFCFKFFIWQLFVQDYTLFAEAGSPVKFLPGFQGPLPFELETGYVGVDEGEEVQLFYYFVKSQSNPGEDPLVLWLTGGPGCTALTALVYEIGPIAFEEVQYNGMIPRLVLNPNSWTEVASIIFLDLPVGTGFSYSTTPSAVKSTGQQTCNQVLQFLTKFLTDHPEFNSNSFYVGGDSYAGILVPMVVELISHGNQNGIEPSINLQGYVLGNPVTTPSSDNFRVPFTHGMGIISDELYESLKRNCKGEYNAKDVDPSNTQCLRDLDRFKEQKDGIQIAHVLEPVCDFYAPKPHQLLSEGRSLVEQFLLLNEFNSLRAFSCRVNGYKLSYTWANDDRVREAIHIHKGSVQNWTRCNLHLQFTNSIDDVVSYHASLSKKGYRSLIYSGDHDYIVPFLATQAWIRSLNYTIVDDWRSWRVDGQVAGHTRTYANRMTFATVKGGGHTAPEYKPKECQSMFKRWISHQPL